MHLIILCSALFHLLPFFALGRFAFVPVGPAGGVPLLGPHCHTQPVVGGFTFFICITWPLHRTWRMSVDREEEVAIKQEDS